MRDLAGTLADLTIVSGDAAVFAVVLGARRGVAM